MPEAAEREPGQLGSSVSVSRMNSAISCGCSMGKKWPLGPSISLSVPSGVVCAISGEAVDGLPPWSPAARSTRTGQVMCGSLDQACDLSASA